MTTLVPTAQQAGVKYTLIDSQGFKAVFNDSADADYVGILSGEDAVSGLDSAEVRSNTSDLVQGDGGVFAGWSYHGQRNITIQGYIQHTSTADRNAKETKLRRVVDNMMRESGTVAWTPDGGVASQVTVRKAQPTRIKGQWMKGFFIGLVAPDPVIYGATLQTSTFAFNTNTTIGNAGSADVWPELLRITGPTTASSSATGPKILRTTGSNVEQFYLPGLVIPTGGYVDIDPRTKTVVDNLGANKYSFFDWSASTWWKLLQAQTANNVVRLQWDSGTTTGTTLRVDWRNGWL